MRVGGSCRQAGSLGSGQVQAVSDEFHEDGGFGGSCGKFRKGIPEGDGDDLFGGGQPRPNGPDPGAEEAPDRPGGRGGENLKQALGDEPESDVAMAGRDQGFHILSNFGSCIDPLNRLPPNPDRARPRHLLVHLLHADVVVALAGQRLMVHEGEVCFPVQRLADQADILGAQCPAVYQRDACRG